MSEASGGVFRECGLEDGVEVWMGRCDEGKVA